MILIDMQMPKNCEECFCNCDTLYCPVSGEKFDWDSFAERRLEKCPLIDAGDVTSKLEELDALRRVIQAEYDRRQKE